MAVNDSSSREKHVNLVLLNGLLVLDSPGLLSNTFTLASQDSLVDAEAVAVDGEQSAVGGDTVTHRNLDHVSGNQIFSLNLANLSITDNLGLVGRVFLQGGDCLFGAALLGDSDDTIENENCENLFKVSQLVLGSKKLR